uniref:Uncharacterized protein n=1 Tax=Arundo donax TaxID=35708 RepID=A0A0A9AR98_ARUDO
MYPYVKSFTLTNSGLSVSGNGSRLAFKRMHSCCCTMQITHSLPMLNGNEQGSTFYLALRISLAG